MDDIANLVLCVLQALCAIFQVGSQLFSVFNGVLQEMLPDVWDSQLQKSSRVNAGGFFHCGYKMTGASNSAPCTLKWKWVSDLSSVWAAWTVGISV